MISTIDNASPTLWQRAVSYVWQNLFDPKRTLTTGNRVQARLFELVVCVLSIREVWGWIPIIARQPGIRVPTGLARFIDLSLLLSRPPAEFNASLITLFLVLAFFARFSWAYLAAFLAFHLQYCARFGMGKTQHSTNALGFALLSLSLAFILFKSKDERAKATEGWTVLLFSAMYTLAGLAKLMASGVSWVQGGHLWHWIHEKQIDMLATSGKIRLSDFQQFILEHSLMATLLLSGGLLAELSGTLLWWRPLRRWLMLSLVAMHLGITLVMNIPFRNNIVLLLTMALPVSEIADFCHARFFPSGQAGSMRKC